MVACWEEGWSIFQIIEIVRPVIKPNMFVMSVINPMCQIQKWNKTENQFSSSWYGMSVWFPGRYLTT